MADVEVIKTVSAPVIPAEVHGFTVSVGIGPYPPDAGHTHRRAMYAELRPIDPTACERMRYLNRERILASGPLTHEAAREIAAEPQGRLAEDVAVDVLARASALARELMAET